MKVLDLSWRSWTCIGGPGPVLEVQKTYKDELQVASMGFSWLITGIIIIGQYKAIIMDFSISFYFLFGNVEGYFSGFLDKIEGSGANREVREGPGIHFLQFWSKSDGGTPPKKQ